MIRQVKKTFVVCIVSTLIIFSGCISINGCNNRFSAEKQVSKTIPVDADTQVKTSVEFNDIVVIGSETDQCQVIANIKISAETQEIANLLLQDTHLELHKNGKLLDIVIKKPDTPEKFSLSGNLEITTSKNSSLDLHTTFGDVKVNNIHNAINIKSSHGNVSLETVQGDVTATTSFADIKCKNVTNSQSELKTCHGDVFMDMIQGDVAASTSFADINCKNMINSQAKLKTSHGAIRINDSSCPKIEAQTSFGNITGNLNQADELNLSTTHGDINFACQNVDQPDINAIVIKGASDKPVCPGFPS